MSQRDSGYARVAFDQYETPEWVTRALLPHIPKQSTIWEPACGSGKMSSVLNAYHSTDIQQGEDFFMEKCPFRINAIITNPPYSVATEFIERSLKLMRENGGFVAMLLRTDFDHAKSRRHIFADHRAFTRKLILTKRIQWFEDSKSSPSFNHAWFMWDWSNMKPPSIAYHFED
jgi:hypothetical protein